MIDEENVWKKGRVVWFIHCLCRTGVEGQQLSQILGRRKVWEGTKGGMGDQLKIKTLRKGSIMLPP